MRTSRNLLAGVAGLALVMPALATAQVAAAPQPAAGAPAQVEPVDPQASAAATTDPQQTADDSSPDIIVTGVLGATSIERAPIAITAVTSAQISQQSPTASVSELLKNVPGVYVNSGLGETRNVVFSRGVSANSLDAASGYFYVSLQEDGLPVEGITKNNFGPDYFSRADILLDHVEALRGGTAAITGPNAPGGIFNYISRNGKSDPGIEASTRLGLEGDGKNPFYRADLYAGGRIGQSDLYYAVGGFYRSSDGARNPGYRMNYGGQVRGNLLWSYGKGKLEVGGKYLDDRNGFYEFLPARNFNDPKIVGPFDNNSSVQPGAAAAHTFYGRGYPSRYDPTNLVHAKGFAAYANWNHDITDNISVENRARYNNNKTDWSTGGLIYDVGVDDFFYNAFVGNLGAPGLYTYKVHGTNSVVAQVRSTTGFDYTIVGPTNLPNGQVVANGVQTIQGVAQTDHSNEFQDQLRLNAKLGNHNLAIGAYIFRGTLKENNATAGIGLSLIGPAPQPTLDVTLLRDGVTYQVTDPSGFPSIADRGNLIDGSQHQFALFGGDTWQISDAFSLEGGLRYERINYNVVTQQPQGGGTKFVADGGIDGNPLTLYDNAPSTLLPPLRVKRNFDYLNYTAAANLRLTSSVQTYIRYTDGKKAPDIGTIAGLNTADQIALNFPDPQRIQQLEMGIKYNRNGISLQAYPFYSRLSNVGGTTVFIDDAGIPYAPPVLFATTKTYGVEFQANARLTNQFNLDAAITIQNPQSRNYRTYIPNTTSRNDDTIVAIPDGDAENNPKLIVRTTGTYRPVENVQIFGTYSYLGKRAANQPNAWYLPGFSTVDLGASWEINERFKIQFNVNNVLNNDGVYSWSRSGGLLTSLQRQTLSKADVAADPNQLFYVIPQQPRSFFLVGSVKF